MQIRTPDPALRLPSIGELVRDADLYRRRSPLIGWREPPRIVPVLDAAAAYKSVGSVTTGTAGASASPAWGTHASGDRGILVVIQGRTDSATDPGAATLTTANGFTAITGAHAGATYTDGFLSRRGAHVTLFEAEATSGSMSAPTVAGITSNTIAAFIVVFDGALTGGSAIDVVSTSTNTGSTGTAVTITGATTTGANEVVLVALGGISGSVTPAVGSWANADLSSITERVDYGATASNAMIIACATGGKAAAGAYGNTTATLDFSGTWIGVTVAIKPTAAVTGVGNMLLLGVGA